MEKEFIPYEEALAMKELGFNELCVGIYHDNSGGEIKFTFGMFHYSKRNSQANTVSGTFIGKKGCYAPLYQQAFRWFQEEHSIWVTFEYDDCDCVEDDICWYVGKCFRYGIGPLFLTNELGDFKTYQEAELACLRKLIKIVTQNKDE